jgi:branched-chain amino acid transport system permease protein
MKDDAGHIDMESEALPLAGRGGASASLITWLCAAIALLLAPMLLGGPSGNAYAITLLSHICAMTVFALSYNLLLGQTGLLSFGHAVYAGMGGWVAVRALNLAGDGLPLPVSLVPLVGGLGGAAFGLLFGWLITRRGGTPFAMISLGIGELVYAVAAMFPAGFGGEAGIATNRVIGDPVWEITFGPDIEVYYLTAAWTFLAALAMYGLTLTPLGQIARAVRDNAERVGFIGYDPRRVRGTMLVAAAFFAGVSGALTALNVEVISAESLGSMRSGMVLLAVVIGGSAYFIGPVLGAIAVTLMAMALSRHTPAWQLYLGLAFAGTVMFVPGGMAGFAATLARQGRQAGWRKTLARYGVASLGLLVLGFGTVELVEPLYRERLRLGQAVTPVHDVAGEVSAWWQIGGGMPWWMAVMAIAVGAGVLAVVHRRGVGADAARAASRRGGA